MDQTPEEILKFSPNPITAMKRYAKQEARSFASWISNQIIAGRTLTKLWADYEAETISDNEMNIPTITNDYEYKAAIDCLIALNQRADAAERLSEIDALGADIVAYELQQGYSPETPRTIRRVLEVAMFKNQIRQRQLADILEVSENRLSEVMNGKRKMNMDFARRLYTKLNIPGDVILSLID